MGSKRRKSRKRRIRQLRIRFAVAASIMILMIVGIFFFATNHDKKKNNDAKETVSGIDKQTQSETKYDTENKSETESKTETKSEEGVVGVSTTGFSIKVVDGLTFVNNILLVNKTYALPESYNPGEIDRSVLEAFNKMQADATSNGLNIWIQSGFRSYEYQKGLYENYVAADGKAAADKYSARPGHSEHQSGLCFDLNTIDDSFANTPEGKWVAAHAHEYGLIIRYPKGKESITGYNYESWHLRYVGVELATYLYENNLCLEEYLGITSQYSGN